MHEKKSTFLLTNVNMLRIVSLQEASIGKYLIEKDFLQRESCVSLGENKEWLTWRVSFRRTDANTKSFKFPNLVTAEKFQVHTKGIK